MVSQTPPASFPVSYQEEVPIVHLPSRFTILEVEAFKVTCEQLFSQSLIASEIVLDFSQTLFIDSSGIGSLIVNLKRAKERRLDFILRQVQPQVMGVFSMTGLTPVLMIEPAQPATEVREAVRSETQLPVTHPSIQSWVKRLLDIVGAIIGLGITAILLIPIAIAIELDDPGPLFFGQIRCGWMGRPFRIWKFRSMVVNAEALREKIQNQAEGAIFKNDQDPRITRVGRFLRRTSLDELPQFWNVLKGEMSLVGTRPPLPQEVERYEVPQWQRLDVKPGMTGEWQVNGRSKIRNFEDVIQLDLKYQENWSLLYDLKLILKTIVILFHKNSGAV